MEFLNENNENENNNNDVNENNNNVNNVCCSFCGVQGHNIRLCNSPEIPRIETSIVNLFVDNYQECLAARLNGIIIRFRFIDKLKTRFLLRHIRVLAVVLGIAPASGFTKEEYAFSLYTFFENVNNMLLLDIATNLNIPYIFNNNDNINNENTPPDYVVRNLLQSFNSVANANTNTNTNTNTNANTNANTNNKFNITSVLDFTHTPEELENICDCGICLDDNIKTENMVKLNCEHSFCGDCITRVLQTALKTPTCALCRASITAIEINSQDNYNRISEFCRPV